MVMVFDNKKVV